MCAAPKEISGRTNSGNGVGHRQDAARRAHLAAFTSGRKDWQAERGRILHRICIRIQARVDKGESLFRSVRLFARRHNGRTFKSAPHRKLALSWKTLVRCYHTWKRGGEVPAAFRLHYSPGRSLLVAPPVIRFIEFCAAQKHANLLSAWQCFAARADSLGRGRRAGQLPYGYEQIRRVFSRAMFRQLQAHLAAIRTAEIELGRLRIQLTAEIRRRLPDRPRRVRREVSYEI